MHHGLKHSYRSGPMTTLRLSLIALAFAALGACSVAPPSTTASASDACGASQFQSLVGGPSSAVSGLDIPGDSRHYGREEAVATDNPSRLNFVHSGTAIESVTNPNSTVVRIFCG